MEAPLFRSRSEEGVTPYLLPFGNAEDGLYLSSTMPDLMPTTSGHRTHKGEHSIREDAWGYIEFLPESNRGHLESVLASAKAFRQAHTGQKGFFTTFQYLAEAPDPLWTRHLPFPELPGFALLTTVLGNSIVDGGFTFMDTHSFWVLYGQHLPDYRRRCGHE